MGAQERLETTGKTRRDETGDRVSNQPLIYLSSVVISFLFFNYLFFFYTLQRYQATILDKGSGKGDGDGDGEGIKTYT